MLELSYFCQFTINHLLLCVKRNYALVFLFFFSFLKWNFLPASIFIFYTYIFSVNATQTRLCDSVSVLFSTCLRFMSFDHLLRRVTSFTRNMLSCYRIWSIIEVSILNGVRIFVHTHGHYTRKIILHSSIAFDLTGVRATSSTIRHEPNR